MEAMASGTPVIISNNTGHTDIVDEAHCYPLRTQTPIPRASASGWYESDVDEVVEALEEVYADQYHAAEKAAKAVQFIAEQYSWPRAIETMVDLMVTNGIFSDRREGASSCLGEAELGLNSNSNPVTGEGADSVFM